MASPSVWSSNFDELERDMEAILRDQNNLDKSSPFDLDYNLDDLNMYRSGSAPPTVEGSRAAFGGFFENPNPNPSTTLEADDEDSMRTNPAYLSYYYTNENINPRLPPPRVSREDWRASQRFHSANPGPSIGGSPVYGAPGAQRYGGVGERVRKVEFEDRVNNNNNRGDVNNSSLFAQQPGVGLTDAGLIASRRKSFADALQDKDSLTLNTPLTGYTLTGSELIQPDPQLPSSPTLSRVRSLGTSSSLSGPGLGPSPSLSGPGLGPSPSLSGPGRSLTPDPLLIRRTPSPLPPVGIRMNNNNNNNNISNISNNNNNMNDINERDLSERFKGLGYGNNKEEDLFRRGANGSGIGYTGADLDPLDYASQMLSLKRNQVGTSSYHGQLADPVYGQYPQTPTESSLNAMNLLPEYQKAYLSALIAQQKLQQYSTGSGSSNNINTGLNLNSNLNLSPNLNLNRGLYGNSMGYMNSPLPGSGSFINSIANRARANERMTRVASMRTYGSDSISSNINNNTGFLSEGFANLSLLEDFKSNKTKSFELSDIIGHVVEFSSDQYGSRFIQQKLETATLEEKNGIFPEIFPHARALMTDVFGNYVIQKFFEYGTETQRRQLANQLKGHVLQLTLQMYGCRVIQKALEVVDFDQQTEMVQELNGAIMRCVRDQNGNHVIQKCIECVPQESIQFIISSFYGHVVELSTHPYGCRVIQRVLEHCDDDETQSIMMEEIMPHVMTLAQDQYGNYVIQHVLQHGKPEERSVIIKKLAGQIVKMSQQKFASNVVEKCLTFGSTAERQILIDEILGTTDENEPLQVMMKDQFANYVVQKVLETCDEANRELILSRIKVHLNALKRYTYGKHIVARVEKLIAAGERVSASSS